MNKSIKNLTNGQNSRKKDFAIARNKHKKYTENKEAKRMWRKIQVKQNKKHYREKKKSKKLMLENLKKA